MRIAAWTPLPPNDHELAVFSSILLEQIAVDPSVHVTAVVRDDLFAATTPLRNVEVIAAKDYDSSMFDIDVYNMANDADACTYVYRELLKRPGVTILHDPALVDFMADYCGGRRRKIFIEEACLNFDQPTVVDDQEFTTSLAFNDPLELLMSRRVVDQSIVTVVHSQWAKDHLRGRFPSGRVTYLPYALQVPDPQRDHHEGGLVVGYFGDVQRDPRVEEIMSAWAAVARDHDDATLRLVDTANSPLDLAQTSARIREAGLDDSVRVVRAETAAQLTQWREGCDAVIDLEWSRAGATNLSLLRHFAAGKTVVASMTPQNLDFSDEVCAKVHVQLSELVGDLSDHLRQMASAPDDTRRRGRVAYRYALRTCDVRAVAERYLEVFRDAADVPAHSLVTQYPSEFSLSTGVNAIASWTATTGLAESARRTAVAMVEAGIALSIVDVDYGNRRDPRRMPAVLETLPVGRPFPIDVTFLNINEFHILPDDQLRSSNSTYLIAAWYWELPALPRNLRSEIDRVDEIWVTSNFVRDIFLRYTDKPITIIPAIVEPVPQPGLTRAHFGLPENVVMFLVTFDANSTFARKNPYASIKAFEEAFSRVERGRDVVLVVKALHLDTYPEVRKDMRTHLDRIWGVLLEDDMSAGEVAALIQMADVYVSLHRSEGFGLGLAEAMYFGRPVIGTANSGNMDFMVATNSCLVSYTSKVVNREDLKDNPSAMPLYEPGNLWVEPDVNDAAKWMRWLYEHPDERVRIGEQAASTIRTKYSVAAAGRAMRDRLSEVTSERLTAIIGADDADELV